MALATKTGHSVVVSSLTTPTSQTSADPDGMFTVSDSLLPTRTFQAGQWVSLNPALRFSGSRVVPAATSTGLSLSAGGSAPFVTMSSGGRSFDLSWPTALPQPVLSGATATYQNVLPGVDLVVTVSPEGAFTSTLVVHSAAAAADAGLQNLQLLASAPGETLTQEPDGGIAVWADNHGPDTVPAFSVTEPEVWDSALPPAGARLVTAGGVTVASPSGLPAYSSVTAPGAYATVTRLPLSVSAGALTLSVPASVLTGKGVQYPLYLDPTAANAATAPTQDAADWTEVESGFPTDDGVQDGSWNSTSQDLQIGYCDFSGCDGLGVARSLFHMPVPTDISNYKNTTVYSADLYLRDIWVATCPTAEPMELWWTGKISSTTTWNSADWIADEEEESFDGYGYSSSCPAPSKGSDVTFGSGSKATAGSATALATLVQNDVRGNVNNQTLGIRAASESNSDQWRQFQPGKTNITLVFTYYNPPNAPSAETNPGGGCATSGTDPAQIGNDNIEFEANNVSDDYSNTESDLETTVDIYYDSGSDPSVDSFVLDGSGDLNQTIPRATVQGWEGTGQHEFYYTETTKNVWSQSAASSKCYFEYNTAGPSQPTVAGMPAAVNPGQEVTGVTFTEASGCGSACPATYEYQIGTTPPVTVTATSGDWSGTIDIGSQLGPLTFSVTGISSVGNPGEGYTQPVDSTMPAGTSVPDGYFSDGSYPDLLTVGSGTNASLYLSRGSGNGAVNPPLDIGSLGNGINAPSGGPADWSGASVLHGNFCGHGVQDVTAYYPSGTHAGNAVILCAFGSSGTLDWGSTFWGSGNSYNIPAGTWEDTNFDTTDNPVTLVPAGDASQLGTGITDVIGVLGNSTIGYELNLYTAFSPAGYLWDQTLESSTTDAPDGTADWENYSLATAQLPDSTNENGDPADTVLLALDRSTGALYESVNSGCATGDCAAGPIIGTPGTWTKITVPWGSTSPTLLQADVNKGSDGQGSGSLEIWTLSGSTATAYTISGTTMTKEGSGSSIAEPDDDWPLNDGSPTIGGSSATDTAIDVVSGKTASLTGSYSWLPDTFFGTTLGFGGSGYATPPTDLIPTSDTTITLTLWFKTTAENGVLFSYQTDALSSGSTTPGGYIPILYVGDDGHLHAAFSVPTANTIGSLNEVTDGQWHYVQLTEVPDGSSETDTLYIDGVEQGSDTQDAGYVQANVNIGAGYIGGGWPDETHNEEDGNQGYLQYYTGQIADVTLTYS